MAGSPPSPPPQRRPSFTPQRFTLFLYLLAAAAALSHSNHPPPAPVGVPNAPHPRAGHDVPPAIGRRARCVLTATLNTVWPAHPRPHKHIPRSRRWHRTRPRPKHPPRLQHRTCRWSGWPLRACRLGEATHPGPPRSNAPPELSPPIPPTFADTILLSDSDDAPAPPTDPCPICLEPFAAACPRRRRPIAWPNCGHRYHFSCLARLRGQVQPPRCAHCRCPWPADPEHDDALSRACGVAGVNPFRDSEAEMPLPGPATQVPPAWHQRGPPPATVTTTANSWLYVPLLWAAAGSLTPDAVTAWQACCGDWWTQARDTLADAPPVDLSAFRAALTLTASTGASAQLARLTAAGPFPAGAHAYLRWLLQVLADEDGYLPAASQEVCLQLYGGLAVAAELDRRSNTFRTAPAPQLSTPAPDPPTPTPPHPTAPFTVPPLPPARRHTRGRGRGRGPRPSPGTQPMVNPDRSGGAETDAPDPRIAAASTSAPAPPFARGLPSLDTVDLCDTLRTRTRTFQSVPRRLQPTYKHALRIALEAITSPPRAPSTSNAGGSSSCSFPASSCTALTTPRSLLRENWTAGQLCSTTVHGSSSFTNLRPPPDPPPGQAPQPPCRTKAHERAGQLRSSNRANCQLLVLPSPPPPWPPSPQPLWQNSATRTAGPNNHKSPLTLTSSSHLPRTHCTLNPTASSPTYAQAAAGLPLARQAWPRNTSAWSLTQMTPPSNSPRRPTASPQRPYPQPSSRPSASAASSPSKNQTAESADSSWATSSGGWSPAPWRNSSAPSFKPLRRPTSMPSPPVLAAKLWHGQCGLPQKCSLNIAFCPLTALAPTTTSHAKRSCKASMTTRGSAPCFLSCGNFTRRLLSTSGTMLPALATPSISTKAANREIPWCRASTRSLLPQRYTTLSAPFSPAKPCSRTWTTRTSYAPQPAPALSMSIWRQPCGATPTSRSIRERPASGMRPAPPRRLANPTPQLPANLGRWPRHAAGRTRGHRVGHPHRQPRICPNPLAVRPR